MQIAITEHTDRTKQAATYLLDCLPCPYETPARQQTKHNNKHNTNTNTVQRTTQNKTQQNTSNVQPAWNTHKTKRQTTYNQNTAQKKGCVLVVRGLLFCFVVVVGNVSRERNHL